MTLTCLSQVRTFDPDDFLQRVVKFANVYSSVSPVPKPLPPKTVTAQDRQARAFDWNAGPSITPLNTHEVSNDLLAMGVSLSRGSSNKFYEG